MGSVEEVLGRQSSSMSGLSTFHYLTLSGPDQVSGFVGQLAVSLALRYSGLDCMVQGLPSIAQQVTAALPSALEARVTFQTHDFLNPTTHPARGCLHLSSCRSRLV